MLDIILFNIQSHNSYKVLNENITFEQGYNPVPFVPTEPYIKDIHLAYIPAENGNCYTEDRNIISDNSIIEFSFNKSREAGFCWNPMRIRDTLNPMILSLQIMFGIQYLILLLLK